MGELVIHVLPPERTHSRAVASQTCVASMQTQEGGETVSCAVHSEQRVRTGGYEYK